MPASFFQHQGLRILLMDFSGEQDPNAVLREIAEARRTVAAQPRDKSLLALSNISRLRYNNEVLAAFRRLTVDNEPHIRASAVFGMQGIGLVAFRANNLLTGSRMKGFETRDEALAWLVAEAAKPWPASGE